MIVKVFSIEPILEIVNKLEKIGAYYKASDLLQKVWVQSLNKNNEISRNIYGELLLRTGAISGYLGRKPLSFTKQISTIKILNQARDIFVKSNNREKIAECENFLALEYYRDGDFSKAFGWVDESVNHRLEQGNEITLHSHIIKSMFLLQETKFNEAISYLDSLRHNFASTTYLLKGSFHTNISIAFKNINNLNQGLKDLQSARYYHNKSNHLIYLATVENNLAHLYKLKSDFQKATQSVDNALYVFNELGDHARSAFTLDTKAQILISLGEFEAAEKLADEAINILKSDNILFMLPDVYLTKQTASSHSQKTPTSVAIKKYFGQKMFDELCESVNQTKQNKNLANNVGLKLCLPPQIPNNQNFFGVWIKNNTFCSLGIKKGFLAVGVKCEVKNGDFVAVCENSTDLVSIGYLDKHFGLVYLEDYTFEPEIFDENDVSIMGKIIGYCEPNTNSDGDYVVTLISA